MCIEPPQGPFDVELRGGPPPATTSDLPEGRATMIAAAPRHRWDAKAGLVETRDGSLLLHGLVAEATPGALDVSVLVNYVPVKAAVRTWNAGRSAQTAAHAKALAFDIELPPQTVAMGRWAEVQTVVQLGDGALDVRRWTLYGGPHPPEGVDCIKPTQVMSRGPRSSRNGSEVTLQSTQAVSLAAWPRGAPRTTFFKLEPRTAAKMDSPAAVAVWPDPFSGPGPTWISTFWSVPDKQ